MSYKEMDAAIKNPIGFWKYSNMRKGRLSEIILKTYNYLYNKYPDIYNEIRKETEHLDDYKHIDDYLNSLVSKIDNA